MKTSGALPNVTFHLRERCLDSREENPFRWVLKTSEALFAGKTVIIVGVPGAFTPTCTANHIPRFEMLHEQFMAEGVDEIFCTAVNDAFVMRQWALSIDIGDCERLRTELDTTSPEARFEAHTRTTYPPPYRR